MTQQDLIKTEAVSSAIWKIWSKAIAAKWANDQTTIAAVEKDPKAYIEGQSENKLDLSGITIKTEDSFGSSVSDDGNDNWTLTLPWPSKMPDGMDSYSMMLDDANPPGGGTSGGNGGSSGGGSASCCCCCIFCCCSC